ncbi:hypothetical protein LI055_08430 [Clostridium perfringens]|uniref:hypothetical protein n=1 Tax=Clostridium perfringens TaxID=1502 RepID=UPI0012FD98D3|nr:hypothetical protein [Clostridium perfringens]MCI2778828.1 hypothetical protein [Clostridium perfringens]MCX0379645.1 hypothetical protein [Clostridium perfringens]MDK0697237.1 hypothetical protein [Clostridium perfringens]MDM0491657.1 hypothetical protein [Clostridium perfringens]
MKKNTKQILVSSILGASIALTVCLLFDYFGITKNIFSYIFILIIFLVISRIINNKYI